MGDGQHGGNLRCTSRSSIESRPRLDFFGDAAAPAGGRSVLWAVDAELAQLGTFSLAFVTSPTSVFSAA
jgi:hypothetical protein